MRPTHILRAAAGPTAMALMAALAAAWPTAQAQTTTLAPQAERISDRAIQADMKAYETLQGRIKGLNDRGRPVRDYFLAKSQCWLDVSFHEYTRNDRGPFPQEAMTESEKLIQGMEQGTALSMDTPLVAGAVRLRPDLWDRAAALRAHAGWRCAAAKAACAEVELVHAGHEHQQLQWRHAKPYVQIAEDLIGEAQQLAEACITPPPPPAPPPAPAAVPSPVPSPVARAAPLPAAPVAEVQLAAHVLFNFDRFDARNMRPFSVVQLEELVRRVQRENLQLKGVRLSGHADRLNSTGKNDYNQRLSEKRVATVRAELERLGVAGALIRTEASGDAQQVSGCEVRFRNQAELRECLLPNRRVEVVIEAVRR